MRTAIRSRSGHIASVNSDPDDALIDDARNAARAAARADFKRDPLFAQEFSQLNSLLTSATTRHGPLIERGAANALEGASMIVQRNVRFPVTRAALAIVNGPDYERLANTQIFHDENDIAGFTDLDVVAIDEENGWGGAFQFRRGGGPTPPKKRRADERELRALNLTLASLLRQMGYGEIETGSAALIDYYGQSGFAEDITITKGDIDAFFDVPIVASIDRMTQAMSEALNAELRNLLRPILRTMGEETSKSDASNTEAAAPVTFAPATFQSRWKRQ